MTDTNIKFTDVFEDKFTVSLNSNRMAITLERRDSGKFPTILCLSHEDTIRLRDELLAKYPVGKQCMTVGDVVVDSRELPAGITINATGNVIINNK